MTPNPSPMHTAHNTQLNQSNNGNNNINHHVPNRPPPPRPAPAHPNSGTMLPHTIRFRTERNDLN